MPHVGDRAHAVDVVPGSDQHGDDSTPPPRSLYDRSPLLQTLGDIAHHVADPAWWTFRRKIGRYYSPPVWMIITWNMLAFAIMAAVFR